MKYRGVSMVVLDILEKMPLDSTVLIIDSDNKTVGEWGYDDIPTQYQVSKVEYICPLEYKRLKLHIYD